ncbi:hypothetical protein HGI47_11245 [Novosphingobium sp. ERN07]|uniref:hypothetical protein n=1 Tax=Novosphingobium sp. ERN07 TaxID=2726187 RepID=UPI0014576605|nr:hypothetical protein [Novosphingobium sp. ERN07]NLR71444.1 hypothetical protein [Novosphingobium sp. ERN07]
MNGGQRIISLDGAATDTDENSVSGAEAPDGSLLLSPDAGVPISRNNDHAPHDEQGEHWLVEDDSADDRPQRNFEWIAPALGGLVIAGWTGFFLWAVILRQKEAIAPDQWAWWITQWSVPVLLVLVTMLLVIRTSRREARRFADVALSLSRESGALEKRLVSINTELSLARDFIAAQGRDLESLGRVAVERLSSSSARLDELVGRNGAQVDRIADVSAAALDNMDKLRGQLPVIANAAKDVTNNIGSAGRTAHLQLEELVSGFQRLNEFGLASERQVAAVRERIEAAVAQFATSSENLAALAEGRFEALARSSAKQAGLMQQSEQAALADWRERSDAHVTALRDALAHLAADHDSLLVQSREQLVRFEDAARTLNAQIGQEAHNLDSELAQRRRTAEADAAKQKLALDQRLGEIDAAIAARRAAMEKAAATATESLAAKLAELDLAIDTQRKLQAAEADNLALRFAEIGQKVSDFTSLLSSSGEEGVQAAATIDASINALTGRLAEMRHALSGTDLEIGELTDSAVRLLELIQAGGDHTRTQIPEALRSTEAGLKGLEDRVFTLRDTLREAGDGGRNLSETVSGARTQVSATINELQQAKKLLADEAIEREARIGELRDLLAAAKSESSALSADIEQRLTGAVAQLTDAAGKAGEDLRNSTAAEVEAVAERLGEHSSAAIARVLQGRAAELIGRLEEAIDAAADASRETAIQMRDQLTKVDELAGNLEARVSRAREKAEEQVNNDFARRAALITESLNSSAIDIAKALSSDVSETAWASYLRGDRGIFTRRAVTLLENADAKAVQSHYEGDGEFREHVNRYIHDFESMLRQLLSTRDGNALGVTLLSSDMGKLYVALAQGIERLRT